MVVLYCLCRSRASIMTGKYSFNLGAQHGVLTPPAPECATAAYKFIPEYLGDSYKKIMVGK